MRRFCLWQEVMNWVIHKKHWLFKFWKDGESYRNISRNLDIIFTTVSSFIARFKRRSTVENKSNKKTKNKTKTSKQKTATARKTSPRLSKILGRLINQNPMVTREELQEDLRSSGCNVTKRTINNRMLSNGLKSRRLQKTPILLKRHRDARLKLVRQHKKKENSFWDWVLWADNTKIELFGYNYRNPMKRKDDESDSPKNMVPTVKFDDSSRMIWGCFSAKGVIKISVMEGKINAQKYK